VLFFEADLGLGLLLLLADFLLEPDFDLELDLLLLGDFLFDLEAVFLLDLETDLLGDLEALLLGDLETLFLGDLVAVFLGDLEAVFLADLAGDLEAGDLDLDLLADLEVDFLVDLDTDLFFDEFFWLGDFDLLGDLEDFLWDLDPGFLPPFLEDWVASLAGLVVPALWP
jgi:hypothetical protein